MSAKGRSRAEESTADEADEHWATDDRYASERRVWDRARSWLPWTSSDRSRGQGAAGAVDGSTDEDADDDAGDGGLLGGTWTTALIVGGAVLFVFPEPITSVVGVLLLLLGGAAWLVDWAS